MERIVSGPGLASVYEFLTKKFPEKVSPVVQQEFEKEIALQGKVVGMHAKTDELCKNAMEIFVGYVRCAFPIQKRFGSRIAVIHAAHTGERLEMQF